VTWQWVILVFIVLAFGARMLSECLRVCEARRDREQKTSIEKPSHVCVTADLVTINAKALTSDHLLQFHQTVVLKRCRYCGHHVVFVCNGSWTTEDFLRTQADPNWLKDQVE
jgi:hypothetical protein